MLNFFVKSLKNKNEEIEKIFDKELIVNYLIYVIFFLQYFNLQMNNK